MTLSIGNLYSAERVARTWCKTVQTMATTYGPRTDSTLTVCQTVVTCGRHGMRLV